MRPEDEREATALQGEAMLVFTRDPAKLMEVLSLYCPEAVLFHEGNAGPCEAGEGAGPPPLKPTLRKVTGSLLRAAMRCSGGQQTRAAAYLGITQQALSLKLKQYPEIAAIYQKKRMYLR